MGITVEHKPVFNEARDFAYTFGTASVFSAGQPSSHIYADGQLVAVMAYEYVGRDIHQWFFSKGSALWLNQETLNQINDYVFDVLGAENLVYEWPADHMGAEKLSHKMIQFMPAVHSDFDIGGTPQRRLTLTKEEWKNYGVL